MQKDNIGNMHIAGKLVTRGVQLQSRIIDIGNGSRVIYVIDLFLYISQL